jgi:hypothetical protein
MVLFQRNKFKLRARKFAYEKPLRGGGGGGHVLSSNETVY